MPKRHPDLFGKIAEFGALMRAVRRAVRGKRGKPRAAAFMAGLETEVLRLERELLAGDWQPGRYVEIEVFEPKHRIVSAAPFRDRGAGERYHRMHQGDEERQDEREMAELYEHLTAPAVGPQTRD